MWVAQAHGADALAAARCAWGAGGSLGQRPNVPEAGRNNRQKDE